MLRELFLCSALFFSLLSTSSSRAVDIGKLFTHAHQAIFNKYTTSIAGISSGIIGIILLGSLCERYMKKDSNLMITINGNSKETIATVGLLGISVASLYAAYKK